MKKLFTVQYNADSDKFLVTEHDEPVSGETFNIDIVDCENGSIIKLGSIVIDTEKVQCSKPVNFSFANPFNDLSADIKRGYLYNSYAANSELLIAADEWRVPTLADWQELFANYSSTQEAAFNLLDPNPDYASTVHASITNADKMFIRQCGYRAANGTFFTLNTAGYYLTQTLIVDTNRYSIQAGVSFANFYEVPVPLNTAHSVRLRKESTELTHGQSSYYTGNDGTIYKTICIHGVEWLQENLIETKFRDGSDIPIVTDDEEWSELTTPARCVYDNNEDNA